MAKNKIANILSAIAIALVLWVISLTLGAPAAQAQDSVYPLAGTTYNGVVQDTGVISESYSARWLNNGQLEVLTPDDPKTFTIAIEVWRGENFIYLASSCTLYLDEGLTGDPWTQASQTLTDEGDGISFNVEPISGNVAWAALKCLHEGTPPTQVYFTYLSYVAR